MRLYFSLGPFLPPLIGFACKGFLVISFLHQAFFTQRKWQKVLGHGVLGQGVLGQGRPRRSVLGAVFFLFCLTTGKDTPFLTPFSAFSGPLLWAQPFSPAFSPQMGHQISTKALASADLSPQSGWWIIEGQPGTGFSVEITPGKMGQENALFFAALLYGDDDRARWYASLGRMTDPHHYQGDLLEFQGGQTLQGGFRPATIKAVLGPITLVFTSPTSAELTLANQQKLRLVRLNF
jgi:hypothetical protein